MNSHPALGTSSDLLTMAEVAGRLHVSLRWLQDFLKTRPHGRMAGRQRLFTPADLAALIQDLPCPSSSSRPVKAGRKTGVSGARITGSTLIAQLKQQIAEQQRSSVPGGNSKSNVVKLPAKVN